MKAGGPLNALIERHNNRTDDTDTAGYMLACVGTKRVAYWSHENTWTYDENEARAWMAKSEASLAMRLVDKELFGYCRLVRVDLCGKFLKGGRVPTVNGY